MVGVTLDAVDGRVSQVHVPRRHVDLEPHHRRAVGQLASGHLLEEAQIVRDAPLTEWRVLAGLGERAAHAPQLLDRRLVNVGLAFFDQFHRQGVELREVV